MSRVNIEALHQEFEREHESGHHGAVRVLAAIAELRDARRVVDAVAEMNPCTIEDPEEDTNTLCLLCGGHGIFDEDTGKYDNNHADDCAWVLARKLTGTP